MDLKAKSQILKLVKYNDPVLRHKTKPVSFPLSKQDRQSIADMLYSIQPEQLVAAGANESAAGMAANQWGINKSIFLYCPEGNDTGKIEVIINPSYEAIAPASVIEASQAQDWEGCYSVPNSTGRITRHLKIRIKYQNEAGETIEKELQGWLARVWQHETDHLNGHLYDDPRTGKCAEKLEFENEEKLMEFYGKVREERQKKFKAESAEPQE